MITDGVSMLDITLLGCGGTMPLPGRWLTSLVVRYRGRNILIDAGEGTQIAMKQAGLSAHDIDLILITHFHGDHVMGLPGMLMSMGTSGRTEPVTIVGPKGLLEIVPKLCVVAGIPFEVMGHELSGRKEEFDVPGFSELHVHAFRVSHSVETWGYSLVLDRAGKFNADAAKALNIPLKYWNRLQKGEEIDSEDGHFTPDMVMGPPRKGLKVTYTTDSRPCDSIREAAVNADLFVCEGMYGDEEKQYAAALKKHMTFSEAAHIAAEAHPKQMWLTHYSPSEQDPEYWMEQTRNIFPETYPGFDGKSGTLKFDAD